MFAVLLLVLPFQMIWAAAAPYCAHETNTSASKHFGHHEHRHQAGGEITPALGDDGNGSGPTTPTAQPATSAAPPRFRRRSPLPRFCFP